MPQPLQPLLVDPAYARDHHVPLRAADDTFDALEPADEYANALEALDDSAEPFHPAERYPAAWTDPDAVDPQPSDPR